MASMTEEQVERFLAEVGTLINRQQGLRRTYEGQGFRELAYNEKLIEFGLEAARKRFLAILAGGADGRMPAPPLDLAAVPEETPPGDGAP